MFWAVRCWLLSVEIRTVSQNSPSNIYGKQSGNDTLFSSVTSCFLRQYHSTNAPYSSPSTCSSYQKEKRAKSRNPLKKKKKQYSFGNLIALDRKEVPPFLAFRRLMYCNSHWEGNLFDGFNWHSCKMIRNSTAVLTHQTNWKNQQNRNYWRFKWVHSLALFISQTVFSQSDLSALLWA